jgi:hypothetical protein
VCTLSSPNLLLIIAFRAVLLAQSPSTSRYRDPTLTDCFTHTLKAWLSSFFT